jgi:hypothetical protein
LQLLIRFDGKIFSLIGVLPRIVHMLVADTELPNGIHGRHLPEAAGGPDPDIRAVVGAPWSAIPTWDEVALPVRSALASYALSASLIAF